MSFIFKYFSFFILCAPVLAGAADGRDPYTYFFNPHTDDLKAELADAKKAGKKAVFLMFEQEGCPGCIHMKQHVLNRSDVQKFYRDRFVNFAMDIYGSVPLNDFSGRNHTEKAYAQASGVKGTPTLVFFDLDGTEVVRILGPVREADEFMLLGEFVASGAYRSRKFAEYKQEVQRKKGS
jgi:thioredoxin-related protein